MRKLTTYLTVVFVIAVSWAFNAQAATIAYMTGSSNPWGISPSHPGSPETAMNTAFGAGNWDKFNGFDSSILTGGYDFVYFDGGNGISDEFDSFFSAANVAALENFVSGGGRAFVNAARWTNGTLNLGFGITMTGDMYSGSGTLVNDPSGALSANSAGSAWSGFYFSHDVVSGGLVNYIVGSQGVVLTGGNYGLGYLMVGGMTSPYWQSQGGDALRANILAYAANVSAVPIPAALPLLLTGIAGAVGVSRRRKGKAKKAA